METESNLFGLMAEFTSPEGILRAARQAYQAGYRKMDAYSPFPLEGLDEAIGLHRPSPVAYIIFLGGLFGGIAGFFMQYFATVIDYPLNIGGRPLNSWPAYIPITFELTVLSAAFAALIGMMIMNRLPEPYHPVFNVPGFDRATRDRFFLSIEKRDPQFNLEQTRRFLQGLGAERVEEIKA